jgi:hypothetical protein
MAYALRVVKSYFFVDMFHEKWKIVMQNETWFRCRVCRRMWRLYCYRRYFFTVTFLSLWRGLGIHQISLSVRFLTNLPVNIGWINSSSKLVGDTAIGCTILVISPRVQWMRLGQFMCILWCRSVAGQLLYSSGIRVMESCIGMSIEQTTSAHFGNIMARSIHLWNFQCTVCSILGKVQGHPATLPVGLWRERLGADYVESTVFALWFRVCQAQAFTITRCNVFVFNTAVNQQALWIADFKEGLWS